VNVSLTEPNWTEIRALYRADETAVLKSVIGHARFSTSQEERIVARARALTQALRAAAEDGSLLARFQQEYQLSSKEGLALMRLAEALLRIPDRPTADALIRDTIGCGNWEQRNSPSLLVNAASFSLEAFSGLLGDKDGESGALKDLAARIGMPVARNALRVALQLMAQRYVFAETIESALESADRSKIYSHSFDMLGESARTAADAQRYFEAYLHAIETVGTSNGTRARPATISIKLTALHPRYEPSQEERMERELTARLVHLLDVARARGVPVTIDAEEADRLEISLRVFQTLAKHRVARDWDGLGLAVQAYQKRATAVIAWLDDLGARVNSRFGVRLVKGAYWDTEIKRCQERGLADYPVFTRKAATDVSYLACARRMLDSPRIFPAFATHNARTIASIVEMAGARRNFEFQKLHGMADGLYEKLLADEPAYRCRLYAPVGSRRELLSYLVRRLLENGANTSFLKQALEGGEAEALADPARHLERHNFTRHPAIPLPRDLFGKRRSNSMGIDLTDVQVQVELRSALQKHWAKGWRATSLATGVRSAGAIAEIRDPANITRVVGEATLATVDDAAAALAVAEKAFPAWVNTPVGARARLLEKAAGKTSPDALAEVREAVDFCRYYAVTARDQFAPTRLPGPTGEMNELRLEGRGVFVCISPWNFPLAIFTGQIAAALVSGNTVVAKPAPQTPLVAYRAVELFRDAGVPPEVLQLVLGGTDVGRALASNPLTSGIAFTGSTAAAQDIQKTLILRGNTAIAPLIAETGGINAMIADSSALPEQLVTDVITSAYQSAGQRCSALRVLFLQEDTADRVLEMLTGAMDQLVIGDPGDIRTDVGPVIDRRARDALAAHVESGKFDVLHASALTAAHKDGWFFAPHLLRMGSTDLDREVFGPVIHVATWKEGTLDEVFDRINRWGYGLTLGLHSRLSSAVDLAKKKARVGNLYVNRSMIGAVVGSQPFGGEGLSGTGPKAGGPRYLSRFATERALCIDTTAAGGNAALVAGFDDAAD
jgi:RHH-type proline utilization regulon transcriptional repressor/proline dehydrogenase/delta 1-pyrroline-5-carboxylate dehydrogenase